MPFNEGQLKAIQQRNSSILVSAPAGSGKTKILVSRIVELIKEGYQIFDFLVLTFTEAAGHEMKQRLTEELHELVAHETNEDMRKHLQQQIDDLPHAYITNFHGFCNTLLMKYGYLVDVMPGFEINSDPLQIKKEVLIKCEEEWIQDEQFQDFLSLYFPGYSLDSFEEILLTIDELSHSIDNFYGFVGEVKTKYYDSLSTSLEDWPLFPYLCQLYYNEIILASDKLTELKVFCEENQLSDFFERPDEQSEKNQLLPTPFDAYYDFLDERKKALEHQLTYDILVQLLRCKPEKAYNMNWKEVDKDIKKTFTKMKTDILQSYQKAVQNYLEDSVEEFIDKMKISALAIDCLVSQGNYLDQFQHAYQLRKKELNQLDFSDLEQYTHQLLEPQYGIVDILYHRFKELMVDEYQDTNQIQESLLLKISQYQKPHIPIFMVGDMKQSIYRFRQADPQIFSQKYDTYSLTDETCAQTKTRRIDLVFNYRSSKIVLDSINYIFHQIMDKSVGGLEYYLDASARLNYDYIGKENNHKEEARQRFFKQKELTTEILIDIYDPASSMDKEQYEAHMVAQKIQKLKEDMKLNGKNIEYKDIVVLMRSTVSFLTFKKVFDLYQIPNHIVLSQGLMTTNEVENMMTFLKAIDNPYNDIALLSILRQPYTCSSIPLDVIAQLRMNQKDISLYECLTVSSNIQIQQFLEVFHELRTLSFQHSPYELLQKIYKITEYPLFVSQLINGHQRKANLDLLLEIVLQTQMKTPYLHDLINALENSSDKAPAQVSSGDQNVVEFMTIHKSKGLEFPIVFVCNMHKQFNTQDSKERFIIDKHMGIATKPRKRVTTEHIDNMIIEYESSYRNIIAKNQLDESINEEMRILYVALTRASQKLIMSGVIKDINEIVALQQKLIVNSDEDIYHKEGTKQILLYDRLRKTNNYLSWILAAILRHPHVIEQCLHIPALKPRAEKLKRMHFEKQITSDETEHAMFSLELTDNQTIEKNIPQYSYQLQTINTDLQEHYDHFIYPYDIEKQQTLAVTKLQELDDDHYLSLTDDKTSISATDKGTLVHLLLSHLSFHQDNIEELIVQLYQEKLYDEQGMKVLMDYKEHLEGFIDSQYYQMISQATHIFKEKPFAYYDQELNQTIHGIFDLVFVYQDQIYVLDYKTDRVSTKSTKKQLIQKHQIQLNYYKKVLQEMYHQDIHAIIYYFNISLGVEF